MVGHCTRKLAVLGFVTAFVAGLSVVSMAAQGASLGTVRLTKNVMANGEPLAAGTYTLRLAPDPVTPVVGQTTSETHWIEFVQNGQVKGRELSSVPTGDDRLKGPAAGTALVQLLLGGDYLRVWINQAGKQYILHLTVAK